MHRFVALANTQHENKYHYDKTEYINNYTPVIITCPTHGEFTQVPSVHLNAKVGCQQCENEAKTKSFEQFETEANSLHKNIYKYDSTTYTNTKQKTTITCDIHGTFDQTPENHIHRQSGCPTCAVLRKMGMYNTFHIQTKNITNNTPGILYVAQFTSKTERFIKVGITTRKDVKYRYGIRHKGYDITTIYQQKLPILQANNIEQDIITLFSKYQYIPHTKFGGYTECFDIHTKNAILQTLAEQDK